jgi:hypothetical protein
MLNAHLAIFDFDICHTCTWATRVGPVKYQVIISLCRFFRGSLIEIIASMTLHLTWSSCLRTFPLLGFEVFPVTKKSHFNRFYRDTQGRDFRPLENYFIYLTLDISNVFFLSFQPSANIVFLNSYS